VVSSIAGIAFLIAAISAFRYVSNVTNAVQDSIQKAGGDYRLTVSYIQLFINV